MGTGWIAWTCLLLAAASPADGDDIFHMNQKRFQIPIRIEPARQAEVRQLLLYMSRDLGRTWEIYARAEPRQKGFDFYAPGDGVLYFSIASLDDRQRQDPPDIYHAPVGQKICIDTVKPVVKILTAERSGDEVQVSWEIQEDHPDWLTGRLEYRLGDAPSGPWVPTGIKLSPRGNYRFRPGAAGDVTVRVVLRDRAKNEGSDERVVSGGRIDHNFTMTGGVAGPVPPPLGSGPPPAPVPTPAGMDSGPAGRGFAPTPLAHSSDGGSAMPVRSGGYTNSDPGPTPTRSALPALQIVNRRQVKLGFNVSKFGPSGLGTVDVYVTTDEGATWTKSADDPHVSLPVTPEGKGGMPVRGTVSVALPKDGQTYGFYLVVKSRAGLGKEPPRPGDPPQVRMEVDTTLPVAELYAPQAAPNSQDSLILTWKAEDRNLAPNPVSLEWSANANGPWTFIGDAQLPNSGKYIWNIQGNTPAKVFLKLTVRDTANNTAIAQTDQPVLIDLARPDVNDVSPVLER
jgi:hypothetical protein